MTFLSFNYFVLYNCINPSKTPNNDSEAANIRPTPYVQSTSIELTLPKIVIETDVNWGIKKINIAAAPNKMVGNKYPLFVNISNADPAKGRINANKTIGLNAISPLAHEPKLANSCPNATSNPVNEVSESLKTSTGNKIMIVAKMPTMILVILISRSLNFFMGLSSVECR